jgi:nucleotide-binding universal stress UspA family protein
MFKEFNLKKPTLAPSLKKILLCFDNSRLSHIASEIALQLAETFDAKVVAIHGYNASMHEGAFRILEPLLPPAYQKEESLQEQRRIHQSLIPAGLERISLSYLKRLEGVFGAACIPFETRVMEGKNFKAIARMLSEVGGDMVILGVSGFNPPRDGFVGSVCLRTLRGDDRNFLIIKKPLRFREPRYVVCLDGSPSAIAALRMAKLFADGYDAELHLLYIFDSSLHREVFGRLKESVIETEEFTFHSEEQEKLHDEFIDKGLEGVGHVILDRAEKEVLEGSLPRVKKVMEGHVYKKICDYASEIGADLLFIGRTGRHAVNGLEIGSVTENVVRFSPCSVFISETGEQKEWMSLK